MGAAENIKPVEGDARLEAIEAQLREALALLRRQVDTEQPRELLTMQEAARVLGVSRWLTLTPLVKTGRIHAIPSPGGRGLRIPRSEVDRVMQEGVAPPLAPSPLAKPARATPRRAVPGSRGTPRSQAQLDAEIAAVGAINIRKLYKK